MSSILDDIKARYGAVPESKIRALPPGMQKLYRSDLPGLISLAEVVCNYIEFVKSPAPIQAGHVYLDQMSAWVQVLKHRADTPRLVKVKPSKVKLRPVRD